VISSYARWWLVPVTLATTLLGGCSALHQRSPDMPEVDPGPQAIVQRDDGRFVSCRGCERPTPKTLANVGYRAPLVTRTTGDAGGYLPTTMATVAQPLPAPTVATAPAPVMPQGQVLLPGRAARRLERALVIFSTDSSNVGDSAKARLAELSALLKQAARVRIVGYTDDIGDQTLNDKLALARAQAVAGQLRQMLGQASQTLLIPSGRGLCCYLVANESWSARAANRRVELLIELEDTPGNAWLIERHQPLLAGPDWTRLTAVGGARAAS